MPHSNKITEYLEAVCRQIRWKRVQPIVLEEIKNHIIDQKSAFLKDGLDEISATDKAIAEMGEPIIVGEQLDRAHRPSPDWVLLTLACAILLLGLAVQFFIGSTLNVALAFEKQTAWALIAIIVMFAAYFADFTIIGKHPKVIFLTLCSITIAYYFFTDYFLIGLVNGRSIYMLYPLLLFPTAFAGFVYSMRNKGYSGIILCGAVFIVPAFLSISMPSLTILFLLCVSCLIILTSAVLKGWFKVRKLLAMLILYIPTAAALSIPLFMVFSKGYGTMRIQTILDPSRGGYIGIVIQHLLSHSQFIGSGIPIDGYVFSGPHSILPGINTDYLLTYLIYRFGWIAFIVITALFAFFVIRAVILCSKQKSVLGFLTSTAIVSTFAVQCIVYIAFNLGFLLFCPLSLPLISYGKLALVTNMFLIGLLLSVFRTGTLVRDKSETVAVNRKRFIQYDNGQIIIDLKQLR